MLSAQDFEIVTKQLGRKPIGALEVTTRDAQGDPVVIKVDPLAEGKPFPSMYWLTGPRVHKAIADVERTAWIKDLELRIIPESSEMLARLKADNERYRDMRWQLYQELHQDDQVQESFLKVIRESGIGGIQDFSRVRCLHMHYAFHLAHGGLVGELLDKEFNIKALLHNGEL